MECIERNCSLIVSVVRGHERAVSRDILDLLFPYDRNVDCFTVSESKICVETKLDQETLRALFMRFPIRNILSARYIVLSEELKTGLEESLKNLCIRAAAKGLRFRKVSVKLKSQDGWRQEYYEQVRRYLLGCANGEGVASIEKVSCKLVLTVRVI